jgi:RHS repeat-associated protein
VHSVANKAYRYGFNGMEKDDELKGSGNSYDFGARIYDPRVGRWLAVDPFDYHYSNTSPYGFALNSPLMFVDPDGKKVIIHYTNEKGKHKKLKLKNMNQLKEDYSNAFVNEVMGVLRTADELGLEEVQDMVTRKESVGIYYKENIRGGAAFEKNGGENPYIMWDPAMSDLLISKEDAQKMHDAVLQFEGENGDTPRPDSKAYQAYVDKKNEFLDPIRNEIVNNSKNLIEPDEFLIHELGHWLDFLGDGIKIFVEEDERYSDDSEDALMDNKNEKDVIDGIEKKYTKLKGKEGRKHHRSVAGGKRINKSKRSSFKDQKNYK